MIQCKGIEPGPTGSKLYRDSWYNVYCEGIEPSPTGLLNCIGIHDTM